MDQVIVMRAVVFVGLVGSLTTQAHASVFSASELSKGDWTTPGYGLELALTSRWSTPSASHQAQGYGFQISPSYYFGDDIRAGLDLNYHFLREPVGGLHNALRVRMGWNPVAWYRASAGVGWTKERRIYDSDRLDIPTWVRTCREMTLPHLFQRQQFFSEESSSFRWGPALDLSGGYGACRSETSQTEWRWMWAAQLLLTFAWR